MVPAVGQWKGPRFLLIPALVAELQQECRPFLPDATVTLARCGQLEALATRAAKLGAEVAPAFYMPLTFPYYSPTSRRRKKGVSPGYCGL
jgi:hypothetical protein